jgi:hypothetical protein
MGEKLVSPQVGLNREFSLKNPGMAQKSDYKGF